MSELVLLEFEKIMQTRSYTALVLEGQSKRFAIYAQASVGKLLQQYLTGAETVRPMTHDLVFSIFRGLDVQVQQVVINDIQDTIYFSRLFLEQKVNGLRHIIEIDSRPSDAITLALLNQAPVYCTKDVLNRIISLEE